jgi:hypothetical protein
MEIDKFHGSKNSIFSNSDTNENRDFHSGRPLYPILTVLRHFRGIVYNSTLFSAAQSIHYLSFCLISLKRG